MFAVTSISAASNKMTACERLNQAFPFPLVMLSMIGFGSVCRALTCVLFDTKRLLPTRCVPDRCAAQLIPQRDTVADATTNISGVLVDDAIPLINLAVFADGKCFGPHQHDMPQRFRVLGTIISIGRLSFMDESGRPKEQYYVAGQIEDGTWSCNVEFSHDVLQGLFGMWNEVENCVHTASQLSQVACLISISCLTKAYFSVKT